MLTITLNIPDDLKQELGKIDEDLHDFIIESLRQRLIKQENERQYHDECKQACFAQENLQGEDDENEKWETL